MDGVESVAGCSVANPGDITITHSELLLLAQAEVGKNAGLGSSFYFIVVLGIAAIAGLFLLVSAIAFVAYGKLWFQAYMSNADVSMLSLIGMGFRQVNSRVIVQAKVMATQAGLDINRKSGISTQRVEAHYLAGGNVANVILAIISAHRAGIPLDFDRAAAIDLAGRDVLDATEDTIIARVGQGIVTSIGSSKSHEEVLANPNKISRALLERGLDAQTAFEIVSIDIATVQVGQNIGARLQADAAEADMRVARAKAERHRSESIALEQEMKAKVAENRARLVDAEAQVPMAMAEAFRKGHIHGMGVAAAR